MRGAFAAIAVALWLAPAASAVDRDFKEIVQAFSEEFRKPPTRIPMFGLANFVTFIARPAGVRHIDLAVFEGVDGRGVMDQKLRGTIERAVGRGWKPFVTVTSRRGGHPETVLVYMKPEGRDCRLLVTSIEANEATVVQLRLNPEGLERWIAAPRDSALHSSSDAE